MTIDRRYWDSDCFLGWLIGEPEKAALCHAVLEDAEEGKTLIVTSALTLAEVLYLKGKPPLPKEEKEKVINFFRSDFIAVRNVTRGIAENARELVWENEIRPKDAIHVATALDANLTLLNTFDKSLLTKNGIIGSPPLRIEKPQVGQTKLQFDGTEE